MLMKADEPVLQISENDDKRYVQIDKHESKYDINSINN